MKWHPPVPGTTRVVSQSAGSSMGRQPQTSPTAHRLRGIGDGGTPGSARGTVASSSVRKPSRDPTPQESALKGPPSRARTPPRTPRQTHKGVPHKAAPPRKPSRASSVSAPSSSKQAPIVIHDDTTSDPNAGLRLTTIVAPPNRLSLIHI